MTVDTKHPQYNQMSQEWETMSACVSGQRAVKAMKTAVLPHPDQTQNKNSHDDRYKSYIGRAIYTNITGRTVHGLQGAAFREEPTVELATGVEYLEDNADGGGQSLVQLSKDVLESLLVRGRDALLVDMPNVDIENPTAEQTQGLQATVKRYGALDLINWETESAGGQTRLTLAVLRERVNVSEDEFTKEMKDQYRVLRLSEGIYSQKLYRDGKPWSGVMEPTLASGSKLDYIPLFIAGAQSNDANVDEVPISDIGYVNIGHYRNSADLEDNAFIHGQLTMGITTSLDDATWDKMNPNGVAVGSRTGMFLGAEGSFHSLQAEPNQLLDKLQERKECQMVALGAKIIEKRSTQDTATGARIDAAGENSILGDIVGNTEEAIRTVVFWCSEFMGESQESTFDMNRQFFPDNVDPQMVAQSIQLFDRGIIAKADVQDYSRKAGIVDNERTNEEIDAESQDQSPLDEL